MYLSLNDVIKMCVNCEVVSQCTVCTACEFPERCGGRFSLPHLSMCEIVCI